MSRLGKMHNHESYGGGKTCSKPLEPWGFIFLEVKVEDGSDDDADEGAKEMTKHEGAWLGQRSVDGSVAKNSRSSLIKIQHHVL